MPPIRALLLDLDGVLVDSGPAHQAAWHALFAPYGVEFGPERYAADAAGRSRDAVIRQVLGRDVDLPTLMARKAELVDAWLASHGARPIPGASDFLHEADRRGLALAIATSSRMPHAFLRAAGLADRVPTIVHRGDVRHGKPAPDLFLEAARRLGIDPGACLVVEDAAVGIEAARTAGCPVVAITTTEQPDDLAAADVIVGELVEIWDRVSFVTT